MAARRTDHAVLAAAAVLPDGACRADAFFHQDTFLQNASIVPGQDAFIVRVPTVPDNALCVSDALGQDSFFCSNNFFCGDTFCAEAPRVDDAFCSDAFCEKSVNGPGNTRTRRRGFGPRGQ